MILVAKISRNNHSLFQGIHYKHYGFVMNGFSSKLVSLSKPVKVTDNTKIY